MVDLIGMMTLRIIFAVCCTLLTSSGLMGQEGNDVFIVKTVLFEVKKAGSHKTSYLFGTHHAFGKSFFDSLTTANQVLNSCDILIKENLNVPGQMAGDIINNRTTTTHWKKYLNEESFAFVKDLFAESQTDFNKMTPTELYVFLNRYYNQTICLRSNDHDTSLSLDDYIASKAVRKNMGLYGLETTEAQIILMNKDVEGMPRKIHKRRLSNIIEEIRTKNRNDCEETSWYAKMEMDYRLNTPCGNTAVLTDRNNRWMKSISELIERKNCFIAVGLSHLMFECGLINQLKALGYTITPVQVH